MSMFSMAAAGFRLVGFRAKSFRAPWAPESLFSCVAKRKVTKREGHPAYAPCGHPARKVRGRVMGFVDRASCPDAKLVRIPANYPAGFPPPARRFRGAPGRAAGHRGPHFSEEPEHGSATLRSCCCFSASSPSAGHDGPLLYRGPLCGGESGSTGRAAGIDRDVDAFSHGQDARSKSPAPAHGLAGQEPGKRQAGCSFSLVTFALSTQRESDSVAAGDRPLFALNTTRASRTECASAGAGGRKFFAIPSANRNAGTFA